MHSIQWIKDNADAFDTALNRRSLDDAAKANFSSKNLLAIDERRRTAIGKLEHAQARRNAASKEIGAAKAAKDEARARALMDEVGALKTGIPEMEQAVASAEKELNDLLATIPNLPLPYPEVPDGADESGNVEHHIYGAKRDYAFTPKQHFELGEALGMMDFETATKLSGSRFVVLKGGLARLERALGQFFLDVHTGEHGYEEVNPPLLVSDDSMFGTAQLPKFEDDQFTATNVAYIKQAAGQYLKNQEPLIKERLKEALERTDADPIQDYSDRSFVTILAQFADIEGAKQTRRWLIPTAEVPLTNLVRDSIVDEDQLPLRYTACTPCFRAEAGAAGRDTRGMIRQHQFTKVELVSITTPEQSRAEHDRMLACAEEVLRRLGLHYRVVTLCSGDMGFASQKTYDIEVWLPGQNAYREISSCSVCGDFQSRRMNARYRTKEGRAIRPLHTLNGSGVAVGRALVAVMETYQQADGSIEVPEALLPYMGAIKTVARKNA